MQSFIVKEPLPALQALVLPNSIEVLDAKSLLQSIPGLRVTYNTMNKAYHGEWWSNLEALDTKCPCNVSLGVAGVYPEGLQVLSLRTECPEPVSVSTGAMTHQSKAYPHQVGFIFLPFSVIHALTVCISVANGFVAFGS